MSIDLKNVFNLEKNVFVEACAGAGKTWLLSKRYAAIMNEFARQPESNTARFDASNILVITFTRKAAAEMAERIYTDLNRLLNDRSLEHVEDGFGSDLRKTSQSVKINIRATFSRNAISTIDSFCAQVLREQSEKLDIDPEFRIQDEADTQKMELETWEGFLGEASRNRDPDLAILLKHLSIRHVTEYIRTLQEHAQLMMEWLQHQSVTSPAELREEFKRAHPLVSNLKEIEGALASLIANLPEPGEILDEEASEYQNLHAVSQLLSKPLDDSYEHGLKLLHHVRQIAVTKTKSNYLKRIIVSKAVWPAPFKDEHRTRMKVFIEAIESLISFDDLMNKTPTQSDLEACLVNHHLARFFMGYWKALNQRLKREGILSFNEVMLKTRELLRDKSIAAFYGQRFQHILFDEFQDTNDLRWDIVRLIAESGTGKLRRHGLFIVGDTKQSIYRFNQADVQVMNRVRGIIEDTGGLYLTADETYRSTESYVSTVVNPLINATFPGEDQIEDIEPYETVYRNTKAAKSIVNDRNYEDISRCSLDVVLTDETSTSYPMDIYRTADLTEEWLTWLSDNRLEPTQGPSIGILLRAFTPILDYIRVFTARGIEFEVLSSKGLFKQQESFDIYHLLSVLVNPLDDLALIGILRSPFFVFKDKEIQKLRSAVARHHGSGWVWNGLQKLFPGICDTLREWQQASAREPLDRLVESIISEDERCLSWISETGGALRLANLDRLILMIHQLSLDGLGLREVHEYFKYQIQHGDAGQAELAGAAKVQIMTIHKAKGLEFPVVLLPGLQSPPPNNNSGIYLGRHQNSWQAGITLDGKVESEQTLMYRQIMAQHKAEEAAEDKRLFYVAVTRAKYGIGFIAQLSPTRKANMHSRWSRYLEPVFDLEVDKSLAEKDLQALQHQWQDRSSTTLIYKLSLGSELLANEQGKPKAAVESIEPLEPCMVVRDYSEISPHTIMTWMDPQQYSGSDERQVGDDLGLETSALTFGRLLHRAMEMEWFNLADHQTEIQLFLEDEGVVDTAEQAPMLGDLKACLQIYRQSDLAQQIAALPATARLPELPVFGYLQSSTEVFKVSGIIDLLYEIDGEWVVLDYKTDKELPDQEQLHDHAYWYQIQTYLWMLKQLYGIEARGELYFNRFDTLIPVPFEASRYFSSLTNSQQVGSLEPFLPSSQDIDIQLEQILDRQTSLNNILIIEPTKNSGELLAQSLAKRGLNHPGLRILTLSEIRKMMEPAGRRLTPYLARLGVAQIAGKRMQWGVVNRLAEAFYKACTGEVVIEDKQALYQSFLAWCQQHAIQIPGEQADLTTLTTSSKLIVNSMHSTAPADYEFLRNVAARYELIFLDPLNSGQASAGFHMRIDDWMTQDEMPSLEKEHDYTPCFSVKEEAILVSSQIRDLLQQGVDPSDIRVAVTSMEQYVPVIKRAFGQQGISVRLSKREPVMERPVSHLAFALIHGRMQRQITWDMAMSVWLHPLVIPSGAEGYARLKLDIEMRKLGVTQISETLPEMVTHPKLQEAATDLMEFLTQTWSITQPLGLVEAAEWLLEILNGFQFAHRLETGSVASKAYTSLKNAILGIRNDWDRYLHRPGSLGDLNRELRERLRGVEVASTRQGFGIDVISLLDTLNLKSGHLFIMGLTEGQFPLTVEANPYLLPARLNPWFLNLHLFKQWLRFPVGNLHITTPLRQSDGTALQESTFSQYLNRQEYPGSLALTEAQQLAQLAGKVFIAPKGRRRIRHNQLAGVSSSGEWYGQLDSQGRKGSYRISATAFDELIKCPQRYWYGRKLRLEPAETDIAQREEIEVGNLVHKVLERFGKADGFQVVTDDFRQAITLLEHIAQDLLEENKIDLDADLLHNKWGELYFKNFHSESQNLITVMLKQELDLLKQFTGSGLHEQAFGDSDDPESWPECLIEGESIDLALQGKIDRVLEDEEYVWASDYKTGVVDMKQSQEFWTSQMLFYYLVLKAQYPDKHVVLTYEQVKDFKDQAVGLKGFIGDTDSDHPVMEIKNSKPTTIQPVTDAGEWSIDRIKSETLHYAQALAENTFPLTDRDEKKACAYCPFERICRKTALPR